MTRLTLAALGAALLVGTADAQPNRPDASDRIERATSGLDLTDSQQARLGALAAETADPEAGALWTLSADVAAVLTDAQIDHLREVQEARRGERRARGERGRRGPGMRGRGARGPRSGARLTDEQREAVRAVAEEIRPQAEALVERFRLGELSDEAFVAEAKALRDEAMTRLGAALPAEAAERMAQAKAWREAAKTAREDALGLTDAQKDAYRALALDRIREAPERPDLRPYLDEDGRFDRQAFREARRAQREAARPEREARRTEAVAILTDEQKDIVAVHRALAGPRGMRRGGPRGAGRMLGPLDRLD